MDAAEVLQLNGHAETAPAQIRRAINAYDRKGNRAAARTARRVLVNLVEPTPV